ncbi:MAG: hypothetical protein QMC67_00050 [Candidatus Wallbacteria bacterium]
MNENWNLTKLNDIKEIKADKNFAFYWETLSEQFLQQYNESKFNELKEDINKAYIFSKDLCYQLRKRAGKLIAVLISAQSNSNVNKKTIKKISERNIELAGKIVKGTNKIYEARIAKIGDRIENGFVTNIKLVNFVSAEYSNISFPFINERGE